MSVVQVFSMHWFECVYKMKFLHFIVHSVVGFSSPLFQSFLECKLCHNCCCDVSLLLLYFHKEYMCIQMEWYIIFQLKHIDGILRAYYAGYVILFRLKLYPWRLAHSWYLLWTFWFHVLERVGWYVLLHLCYSRGSFL